MGSEIIKIIPCSLKSQKPTEIFQDGNELELGVNYLRYRIHFLATEPVDENDKSLGDKENVLNMFDVLALKRNIAGIEFSVTADGKRWLVAVLVDGFGGDIKIYFRTKQSGAELADKLRTWLLI